MPEKLKARDADARRVIGMRRDNAAFDAALASLIGRSRGPCRSRSRCGGG
ncbi:MAG: hypothetical protein HPM95_04195 [Alphaproteobacteria bacterium]|nr:hypothetical protein [Alphaproteobacteria bacterium]